ncbi:MAG TPA: DUF1761 domain-containing protein [Gammaproteobacteria bacterium]|jgi:hypothetical protein|nr:DUF1761 domain-containing protein [Gammaproteobacteria bacterium]MDP6732852.1 DUF1761 domain-containing protein [Gammaproteobacteria bacterium]HAJ76915.1 DUF1761 domain-containing protein [Gammaproteobacteria bacterium]|tara:strand:- start:2270 stop:2656 length:387 start_codon:yes stop_codon:yes gene_type:complete
MEILFIGVNWLAVGVSTILCFILGGFWYSPKLFGVKWAEGVGVPTGPGTKQPIGALLMQFVATLLLAWIMSVAHNNGAYPTAVLIVITAACLVMAANMFAKHDNDSTIIEGAFVIVMALIMSVCNYLF